jgi:hypothetical protein
MIEYYRSCNIKPHAVINSRSIFRGYEAALDSINPNPEDYIILCHDDIKLLMDSNLFLEVLLTEFAKPDTGFIGPAGTTHLGDTAVWWDQNMWKENKHSGVVWHGKINHPDNNFMPTYYGNYRQVVVLDGLFLACKYKVLQDINISKPRYFTGDWDFYDIYYTYQAHKLGYKNKAVPILLAHESFGNLAGRDSWHENRVGFIKEFKYDLPLRIS